MKSVVIISTADLYYGATAAVARMNNYARALALANVDVYMLPTDSLTANNQWSEVEPHIYTFPKEKSKSRKGYNLFYVSSLVRKIKRRLKAIKGEVVVLNYPSTTSMLVDILMLISIRKIPVYCELNEVRRFASGSNNNTVRNRLYNSLIEKTYKWYDGIVFISRHIWDYYSSKVRKSVIVPILSDCSKSYTPSKGINTLDFVFVGSVSFPKENLEELFEGFCSFAKEHPEAQLKLYGPISPSDQKRLEGFVEKNDIKEHILYLGKLQHSEVEEVLSTAGALLLSRSNNKQNYYGFSTKLSEYAVSGTPIIMTNTGVVADYFQDGVNCLMCEGYDRNAFKTKFNELAQMSVAEKHQMAKKAYGVAQKYFDYRLYPETLMGFLFNSTKHEKTN